jgi:glycosyltransferase involved in cell wall biosynthesis
VKVLVQAYACSPDWGSEEGVGWNYVLALSKKCQLHVMVQEKYRQSINRYFEREPLENLTFYFMKHTSLERSLMKSGLTYYIAYRLWQKRAYNDAIQLHAIHHFDLTHVLTYIGFRTPGYFYQLPIPSVWGPIGGAQNFPWKCLSGLTITGIIKEGCRNVANILQRDFSSHYLRASKRSTIITATGQTAAFLKLHNVISVPVTGCRKNEIERAPKMFVHNAPLSILWSGLHIERKRLDILIHSLKNAQFEYNVTVLGDGPLTDYWKKLTRICEVAENFHFMGKIPHDEALRMFGKSDIFVFTSLRETSATVILESLSKGLPVIALGINGACDIIDDSCGYLIPIRKVNSMVADLRALLQQLAHNRDVLYSKSIGALKRAHYYTWEKNSETVFEIYKKSVQTSLVSV